jgi:hypothetical protein
MTMVAVAQTIDLTPEIRMAQARSYEEWRAAAEAEDERTGAALWKAKDESRRYDYKVIRRRLEELREVRASGDPRAARSRPPRAGRGSWSSGARPSSG